MQRISFLLLSIIVFSWGCGPAKKAIDESQISPYLMPEIYSDEQIQHFIDSLEAVNPEKWIAAVQHTPDSVFHAVKQLEIEVDPASFAQLKKGMVAGKMDKATARKIFTGLPEDWWKDQQCENDSSCVELHYFPMEDERDTKTHFAVSPGKGATMAWECKVFFFENKTLVASIDVMHRYGLEEIGHYIGPEDDCYVHFLQNFESGTGAWRYNECYYRFHNGKLEPVLNFIQNSNLAQPGIRTFQFETKTISHNPLKFRLVYTVELPDTLEREMPFLKDSVGVKCAWDAQNGKYEPQFQDAILTRQEYLAFTHFPENNLFFVHAYAGKLKRKMARNDFGLAPNITNYMQWIMYTTYHPEFLDRE